MNERQKWVINIVGSNGVGKSTRVTCLVEYLEMKFGKGETVIRTSFKTKKDEIIGTIYKSSIGNIFIHGAKNTRGIWVGLDNGYFPSYQSRYDLINNIFEEYDIDVYLQEGYFNNRSHAFTLEALRENGVKVDKVTEIITVYGNIDEYIKRCNERTGKNRDESWALNSAGWNSNQGETKTKKRLLDEYKRGEIETEIIDGDMNDPRDFWVKFLFNENFDWSEKKENSNTLDDF